ncbi:hypothetical protein GGR26_003426 [Lewinella marina]|uniref:Tat pathway signal protein n=1 Tax=Neolewinella marina TaxID=438751 RepID=A0A2G0CCH2_9BACT|nr:gluconate 2-dehydrogenase subunit 3 family protein [Neolewinella marina]NJB87642.1 hypothetical protein [Neolewinella marina]PHK97673.1 Tat pathway signal protein [Neolewinella marina]
MDRRKTLKTLIGGAVGTAIFTQTGCRNDDVAPASAVEPETKGYGLRTAWESEREELLRQQRFFSDFELETIGVLADIIVPAAEDHPKATDTGVVDFIEFMALDQPHVHQTRMRGGLAWLNAESSQRYDGKAFIEATPDEQIALVDEIAYPEVIEDNPLHPLAPGVKFFDHMRFMVITGFFTSKEGIEYLGYMGNQPNVWDGVPQEVLDKHGLAYDEELLPKYVDQSRRTITAEWDDDGNLIS